MHWEEPPLNRSGSGDSFKTLVDHKIRERRRDERRLLSIVPQNISSKRETPALPMHEIIALLDDCPCPQQHNSTGKH